MKIVPPPMAAVFSLALALAAFLIFASCSTVPRSVVVPLTIEGATYVGNQACFECHTNYSRAFASSVHARVHVESAAMKGGTGCESCHGPASKHVAVGGGRGRFIHNPGKDPQACFQCHLEAHAQFNLPSHHPVAEGKMNCVQCHDPHGRDILKPTGLGLGMARQNETCGECHREQAKPHVFEHRAMWEGCSSCHNPHGSVNDKLLLQRDANLCLKCHAQAGSGGSVMIGKVDHGFLIRQGSCWSAGCHPSVHGSNVSPKFHY